MRDLHTDTATLPIVVWLTTNLAHRRPCKSSAAITNRKRRGPRLPKLHPSRSVGNSTSPPARRAMRLFLGVDRLVRARLGRSHRLPAVLLLMSSETRRICFDIPAKTFILAAHSTRTIRSETTARGSSSLEYSCISPVPARRHSFNYSEHLSSSSWRTEIWNFEGQTTSQSRSSTLLM